MSKTIPRNHTRKVAEVKARAKRARLMELSSNFGGVTIDPAKAWEELAKYDFARLVEIDENHWTVRVHSNCWFDLYTE